MKGLVQTATNARAGFCARGSPCENARFFPRAVGALGLVPAALHYKPYTAENFRVTYLRNGSIDSGLSVTTLMSSAARCGMIKAGAHVKRTRAGLTV